jgi:fructose-bisphosphate aldolase class II
MASTGAVRKHLIENTANFDPRKFLKEATNAMSDICAARFEAFGSAGNADKIKVSSLDTMSQRYLSGENAPYQSRQSQDCNSSAPVFQYCA